MYEQAAAMGATLGTVAACCGGGGLTSGIALALHTLEPQCRVWTAEPENYDDTADSLELGQRVAVASQESTICDALQAAMPGVANFEVSVWRSCRSAARGKKGGREGGKEGGREREGGREGGNGRSKERSKERGREGGREGGNGRSKERSKEGGREGGREGGNGRSKERGKARFGGGVRCWVY